MTEMIASVLEPNAWLAGVLVLALLAGPPRETRTDRVPSAPADGRGRARR